MKGATGARTRAEVAAEVIAVVARQAQPGDRLGSRVEFRERCGVSVGTLHEALRLLQVTGEVVVRPGPGGGVFAGERSSLRELWQDVRDWPAAPPDYEQAVRVLDALAPLVLQDAVDGCDVEAARRLQEHLDALRTATSGSLRDVARASLELFARVVSLSPALPLRATAGAVLRTQIVALPPVSAAIDPLWRDVVESHVCAVEGMVHAVVAGDAAAALGLRRHPSFMALFHALGSKQSPSSGLGPRLEPRRGAASGETA